METPTFSESDVIKLFTDPNYRGFIRGLRDRCDRDNSMSTSPGHVVPTDYVESLFKKLPWLLNELQQPTTDNKSD